jgi:hypothetical protein
MPKEKLKLSEYWKNRAKRVRQFLISSQTEKKTECQMFVLANGFVNAPFDKRESKDLYGYRLSPLVDMNHGYIRSQNGFVLNALKNRKDNEVKYAQYLQKNILIQSFQERRMFINPNEKEKLTTEAIWKCGEGQYGYYHPQEGKEFHFGYDAHPSGLADILRHEEKMPGKFTQLIGNIGARLDSYTAMRILLEVYPNFLLTEADTRPVLGDYLEEIFDHNIESQVKEDIAFEVGDYTGIYRMYAQMIVDMDLAIITSDFGSVLRPEILEVKQCFIEQVKQCSDQRIMKVTEALQRVADMMILCPPKETSLPGLPIAGLYKSMYCTFAMNGFFKAFEIAQEICPSPKIQVSIKSYFEWLAQVCAIAPSTEWVDHVSQAREEADVFFFDLHPNNVLETHQCANDLKTLISRMGEWNDKPRVLVLDVTLNSLEDPEILALHAMAQPMFDRGLILILLQSLTKFAQLGLDKRSAGLIVIYCKEERCLRDRLDSVPDLQAPDVLTCQYFSYFLRNNSVRLYLEVINRNVQSLYKKTLLLAQQQEVLVFDHFQLTLQQDDKACYVALNMKGLAAQFPVEDALTADQCQKMLEDIFERLLYPLLTYEKLPISQRMSIGFTAASINIVEDSIRMTVGIEAESLLERYAQVLAYAFFILNRVETNIVFNEASYLEQAVRFYKIPQDISGQMLKVFHDDGSSNPNTTGFYDCQFYTRSGQLIDFSQATLFQKRMALASFGQLKLTFCNDVRKCELSSLQIVTKDPYSFSYGPFKVHKPEGRVEVSIIIQQDKIFVKQAGVEGHENNMVYQKGHVKLNFSHMMRHDCLDCIQANHYEKKDTFHSVPVDDRWLRFENDQWVLKPDKCFYQKNGIRLFSRILGQHVRIELEFWRQKTVFKRYLMSKFGSVMELFSAIKAEGADKLFSKWLFKIADSGQLENAAISSARFLNVISPLLQKRNRKIEHGDFKLKISKRFPS